MRIIALSVVVSLFALHVGAQSLTDTLLIRMASLNFIEGYYTGNVVRVEKAIHPKLVEKVLSRDKSGKFVIQNMDAIQLIHKTKLVNYKNDLSDNDFDTKVIIFDIAKDIASVKVTQRKLNYIDYLHLVKINEEWKIVNVMWTITE